MYSESTPVTQSVRFYRVGLACEAASGIGCGIRAKPILRKLEANEAIAAASLHRSGTLLAISWKPGCEDEGAVASVFTREECGCVEMIIDPQERRALLRTLGRPELWYSGAAVDELSAEEASVIAGRVVQRLRSKAALDADKAARLTRSIAEACNRVLTTEAPGTSASREARLRNAILSAGRLHLDEDQYGLLQQAAAHRPLPDER
jgi:hypothetical protein